MTSCPTSRPPFSRRRPATGLAVAVMTCLVGLLVGSGSVVAAHAAPSDRASATAATNRPVTAQTHAAKPRAVTLKHNRLYRSKAMTPVGCAAQSTVPLDNASNLEAYYQSVLPCLNKAWAKDWAKLRAAGIRFRAPRLVVHDGATPGPCGPGLSLSYYCGLNKTIYMYGPEIVNPWNQYDTDYSHGLTKLAATHTLAHEYGHHVQQLVGILRAIGKRYSGRTERRSELQASCLGNTFLSSQRDAYPIAPDYLLRPDLWRYITVSNHGSIASQQYWTERGYLEAEPSACNTFKAPKARVS